MEQASDDVGYTGHKYDADLELVYAQARYYDPVIGRFYSNDPIGFVGTFDTFNRYSYVGNNPYKYIDPNGEARKVGDPWSDGDAGAGAADFVKDLARNGIFEKTGNKKEDAKSTKSNSVKKSARLKELHQEKEWVISLGRRKIRLNKKMQEIIMEKWLVMIVASLLKI